MDAASSQHLHGRGAPRLFAQFVVLARLTAGDAPTARARLEHELGSELTERLLGALARRGDRSPFALV